MVFKEISLNDCCIWNEFYVFKIIYKIDVYVLDMGKIILWMFNKNC